MIFKLLSELSSCELRTVFGRVGKRELFRESQAIVQLTIYLVNIGQDPYTYRFKKSLPEVNKVEATENSNLARVKNIADNVSEYVPESQFEAAVFENVAETSQKTVDHHDVSEEKFLAGLNI